MEDCEGLDLLLLKGRYIGFIVEMNVELNLLDHLEKCSSCSARVLKAIEDDERVPGLGALFHRGEIVEDGMPLYNGDTKSFMADRISWRKRKLRDILYSAELELDELRRGRLDLL